MTWASLLLVLVAFFHPQTVQRRGTTPGTPPPPAYLRAIQSQQDQPDKARIVFHSGLIVLIEEQPANPLVAVRTTIMAGSRDEGQGERGAAGLAAHILFSDGPFAKGIQKLSGNAQLQLDPHWTSFSSVVPSDNLARVLDVHAELLTFPDNPPERIALHRELFRPGDTPLLPGRVTGTSLHEAFRLVPSTEQPVSDAIDHPRLKRFHQRHYRRSKVVLTLSGGVIREQILEKLVQLHGRGRAAPEAFKVADDWKPGSFSYQFTQGKIGQTWVFFRYRTPGRAHPDYYPLLLLSYALGRGRGSLLARQLLDGPQGAAAVDSMLEAGLSSGVLQVTLVPIDEHIDAAQITTLAEMAIIKDEGVGDEQLRRAKALCLADYFQSMETLESRGHIFTLHELLGSGLDRDRIPARIAEVSNVDLKRVAARYLTDANLSVVELMPEGADVRTFTSDTYLDTVRTLLPPAVGRARETREAPARREPVSLQPVLDFKPSYLRHDLRKTSVVRGPDVYFQENHTQPLVRLGLFYLGGRTDEPPGKSGITEVMLRALLSSGLRGKGLATVTDLEQTGADIRVVNEPDFFGFQSTVLSPHLQPLLRRLIEWLREAPIEEADLQSARRKTLALLDLDRAVAGITEAELWNDHPYGQGRYGTGEDLNGLDVEAVQEWRQAHLAQFHPLIVIRGDFAGSSFLQEFVTTLSDRRLQTAEPTADDLSQPVAARSEGEGVLLFAGPALATHQERVLHVAESMLGGPGGRLAESLWDEQGLALPQDFIHLPRLKGSTIILTFQPTPGREEEARTQVLKQLDQLKDQLPRRDLFLSGLSRSITRFYERRQDSAQFVRDVALYVFGGGRADFETEFLAGVKDVDADELQTLAEDYFKDTEVVK
jgi:zinc protease